MIKKWLILLGGILGLSAGPWVAAATPQPKALNNLVAELLSLRREDLAAKRQVPFTNPRDGWCYLAVEGDASLGLDDEAAPLQLWPAGKGWAEAMHHLSPGQHLLRIEGQPVSLVVRAVPSLQHAFYHSGDAWNLSFGPFDDWDYLKANILPNINVIISAGTRKPPGYEQAKAAGLRWIGNPAEQLWYAREDHLDEWKALGRGWLTVVTVPGGADVTADEVCRFWSGSIGLNEPRMDGIMVDEFPGGDEPKYDAYRQAVERIYADPKFKGKTISPYSCGGGGILSGYTGHDRCQEFARACMKGGGDICIERYLAEQPTQQLAASHIQQELVSGWNLPRFAQEFPGVARRTVMVLGYMSAVGESLNVNPGVDFKVFLDMQMHALANEPAYAGLGGIQWYTCGYADDETVRWASRLLRHYAIEGHRDMLSPKLGFKYELDHLANPDFADGTRGWKLEPAEDNAIVAAQYPKYGYLQFRYTSDGTGDRFLVMKRSALKPNVISQTIRNLTPGRLYSLKMITGDYQDLLQERQNKQLHAISIGIDNVEMQPGARMSFQEAFPSHYARPVGPFKAGHSYYMNYHWRVFRAKGTEADLNIRDWKGQNDPGGPPGQELAVNFVEVQPYYGD